MGFWSWFGRGKDVQAPSEVAEQPPPQQKESQPQIPPPRIIQRIDPLKLSAVMRAIVIEQYGGINALKYIKEFPVPTLEQEEQTTSPSPRHIALKKQEKDRVLVRLVAASVNHADWITRAGNISLFHRILFPHVLGKDGSGIVVQVDPDVTEFKVGDEVFGMSRDDGTYAEYIVFHKNEIAKKPENVSYFEAAAAPSASLAAYQSLITTANLKKGQRVLIHGAAGAAGSVAVQLAKEIGAEVFATTSTKHVDYVKSLGADIVIDYTKEDFSKAIPNVDVVFDTVGGKQIRDSSMKIINGKGKFVTIAELGKKKLGAWEYSRFAFLMWKYQVLSFFKQPTYHYVATQPNREMLEKIAKLMQEGKIKMRVGHVLPLEEAPEAHAMLESNKADGKIVLDIMQMGEW